MARIEPSRSQATAQVLQKNQALVKATVDRDIRSVKTEVKHPAPSSATKGTRVDIRA